MDFDLKICVPQKGFEKNFRLSTHFTTISQLEKQIRERIVDLPKTLSFFSDKNQTFPELNPSWSLISAKLVSYSQEPKTLFIFYQELEIKKKADIVICDQPLPVKENKEHVNSQPQKKPKKPLVLDDFLVTIIDPLLVSNRTFMLNPLITICELLEYYKALIFPEMSDERLSLASVSSKEIYDPKLSILDITNENEVAFNLVRDAESIGSVQKTRSLNEVSDESIDLEFVEKKVKKEEKKGFDKEVKKELRRKTSELIEIDDDVAPENRENGKQNTAVQILTNITKNLDTLLKLEKVEGNPQRKYNQIWSKVDPFVIDEDQ